MQMSYEVSFHFIFQHFFLFLAFFFLSFFFFFKISFILPCSSCFLHFGLQDLFFFLFFHFSLLTFLSDITLSLFTLPFCIFSLVLLSFCVFLSYSLIGPTLSLLYYSLTFCFIFLPFFSSLFYLFIFVVSLSLS